MWTCLVLGLLHQAPANDDVTVSSTGGSQFESKTATVTLKNGAIVEATLESFFGAMLDVVRVPPALVLPENAEALSAVELALFGVAVDASADPALHWLAGRHDRDARGVGAPQFGLKVIRTTDRKWKKILNHEPGVFYWIIYKGFLHTSSDIRTHFGESGGGTDVVVASDPSTGRDIHVTCHGV
jgi:hypothetical protein